MADGERILAAVKTAQLSLNIDHPRISQTDPESIRIFFNKYDQYSNQLISRARQFPSEAGPGIRKIEPVLPVDIKLCVY